MGVAKSASTKRRGDCGSPKPAAANAMMNILTIRPRCAIELNIVAFLSAFAVLNAHWSSRIGHRIGNNIRDN
jgi:hypothetical protein